MGGRACRRDLALVAEFRPPRSVPSVGECPSVFVSSSSICSTSHPSPLLSASPALPMLETAAIDRPSRRICQPAGHFDAAWSSATSSRRSVTSPRHLFFARAPHVHGRQSCLLSVVVLCPDDDSSHHHPYLPMVITPESSSNSST
jgi:hypothetical protein